MTSHEESQVVLKTWLGGEDPACNADAVLLVCKNAACNADPILLYVKSPHVNADLIPLVCEQPV